MAPALLWNVIKPKKVTICVFNMLKPAFACYVTKQTPGWRVAFMIL